MSDSDKAKTPLDRFVSHTKSTLRISAEGLYWEKERRFGRVTTAAQGELALSQILFPLLFLSP
jgi:hypothetical protein